MAPRRRQAAPSAGFAAPSFASLPEGALVHILSLLSRTGRHTAALVSRRWHAAAHSPQLLADVLCPNADSRRLESLTAWLPRHGQHVRSLDLSCHPEDGESGPVTWQLAGCLQAFAAVAGSLERLSLSAQSEPGLCVTPWAAALRRLVRLSLWADPCTLRICSSLSGLTALTALTLSGTPVKIDAAVQLPPNVELLWFIDRQGEELPPQLSSLSRLSALELSDGAWEPGSFHVLTSLPRLRRLSLGPTSHLPACLPQLSGLSELVLREAGKAMLAEAACAAVDAALQQLPQLTSLCIDDAPDRCGPFAALAALSRLQRCCLGNAERGFRPQQDPPLQLPTGPWAGSLRSLGAGWDVLPHSSQLLSAATQLTQLAVTGGSLEEYSPEFWRWAETHRSLQRLQIDVWGSLPAWMVQCMLALKDARPGLVVQVAEAFDDGMFSEQWRVWV